MKNSEQNIVTSEHKKYTIESWERYLTEANNRLHHRSVRAKYDERRFYKRDIKPSYQQEFIKFMQRYEEQHREQLESAHQCYDTAISEEFINDTYELVQDDELKNLLKKCKVLVVTANPIEKAVLHYCIMKKGDNCRITRVLYGTNAYFIFKWNSYWVAHIHQPQTGSYKDLGLNTTLHEALKYFNPNVVLSLGVAFGIDYKTQNIGDVIVSKKLYPYSENKRDEKNIKPDRSQDKIIDNWLDVRFVNANGFLDGVTYGGVLSGGSVMSSFSEKERVCTAYSKSDYVVGGEMEGSALFQVSHNYGIPCAVIKGICDWGIAKNDIFPDDPLREERFKDSLQAFAMSSVINKCEPLFRDKTLFITSKNSNIDIEKKNKHLFISNLLSYIVMLIIGICINHPENINNIRFIGKASIFFSIFGFIYLFYTYLRKNKSIGLFDGMK